LHWKMKSKEDPEWEKKCGEWVSEVTKEPVDSAHLFECLSDGIILIKLVNTIKPDTIKAWNKIESKEHKGLALAATGNIRLYLAAVQQMGVPGVDMFLVEDLRTGRLETNGLKNTDKICLNLFYKGPWGWCVEISLLCRVLLREIMVGRDRWWDRVSQLRDPKRGRTWSSTHIETWNKSRNQIWKRCSICKEKKKTEKRGCFVFNFGL
jgi:hypothetical protein